MTKIIWLVNPAVMPPKHETRIQTIKRGEYLQKLGYKVFIIGGSFLHNTDINLITGREKYKEVKYDDLNFIHIKTKSYKDNGIGRFYHLFEFHIRLHLIAKKLPSPDVISLVAAVPFCNVTYFTAKKLNAKFVVDIVDLWPESFVAYDLISKGNLFLKLAYRAENWLYARADNIVFSMEGGKDYIIEKQWDRGFFSKVDLEKICYVNNGVDIKEFDYNMINFQLDDSDLDDSESFKVIYLGSIRRANDIMQLIEAANFLKDKPNIKILIYGDGDDRERLVRYCHDEKIDNVVFKQKWVEIKYVPYILSKSSLNILNYKNSDIFRYGGSQSKSFQYMASGKPILSNIKMNYCPITKFNIGIAKEFSSSKEYANSIMKFVEMDKDDYDEICTDARRAAHEYDYANLTKKYETYVLLD